jgi:hypothetical protein
MVLLIVFAVFGAALGAYMRPRPVAVVLALVVAGAIRAGLQLAAGLIERTPAPPAWMTMLDDIIAAPEAGYVALIAVCGAGAFFSALMCLAFDHGPGEGFWLPKDGAVRRRDGSGRYQRLARMVEDRPEQSAAEARIKAAHGG